MVQVPTRLPAASEYYTACKNLFFCGVADVVWMSWVMDHMGDLGSSQSVTVSSMMDIRSTSRSVTLCCLCLIKWINNKLTIFYIYDKFLN